MFDFNPINYGSQLGLDKLPDPRLLALRREELSLAQQQQRAQMEAVQQEAQSQAEYDAAVLGLQKNPTVQGFVDLQLRFPKQASGIKTAFETRSKEQQDEELKTGAKLYGLLRSGRLDAAKSELSARIEAGRARGSDISEETQILELINDDPKKAAEFVGILLSSAAGPEKFAAIQDSLRLGSAPNLRDVAPGSVIIDPDQIDPVTGKPKVVFESPFKPQLVTGPNGEVLEYTPGGGDPSSGGAGGDIVSRMLPITLQSESGNRDYAPNGQPLTSSKGAVGRMQVMPGTNRDPGFGVRPAQNDSMEERARVGRDYLGAMVDLYKNPAQAWAAYNAGPGAVDKAIKDGGPNWLSKLPKETQDYVRKNMAALQSGGRGGSSIRALTGGRNQDDKPKYRILSPEEVAAQGLNPSLRYQMSPDGQVTLIGGQDIKTRAGRAIPDSTAKRVEDAVAIRDTMDRALSTFRDDYAGNTVTGGLENTMQVWFGTGTPGQRDWWANFRQTDNQIRNDLFGSALTATEKAAYEATTISERMQPGEIRKNLQRRAQIIKRALGRQQNFLKKNGYDPEAVDALYSNDALDGATQAPVRVRSVQEAMKLKPGTIYVTPDGRTMRR